MGNEDRWRPKRKGEVLKENIDKHSNLLKFTRDLESDLTGKHATSRYGLKEHATADVHSRSVLSTTLTPASEHDSKHLLHLTITGYHNTRAWFTTILKNIWDTMSRNMAFNIFRGSKLLADV